MRSLIMAVGIFAAAFAVTAACRKRKRGLGMSFLELYKDNDTDLDVLLGG
ncbi:MAG: hypothetical protein NC299_02515 [Lachnospiraceae bacterium]|nr:hypothetical protein [Ruminococcus sp.]MCM1274223.1 hypothetical protein [Lachnospiraceae bacterium]